MSVKEQYVGEENLSIYPNPNNGTFDVVYKSNIPEPVEISVYDLMGKLQYNIISKKDAGEKKIPINLITLSKGMYFVSVKGINTATTGKFVIK